MQVTYDIISTPQACPFSSFHYEAWVRAEKPTHLDGIPKVFHGDPRDTPTCLDIFKGEQWILVSLE